MKNYLDPYRIIALIGLAKNTGKTTTLNTIKSLYKDKIIAITSIGLDGEKLDQITALEKPPIKALPNELIATARACLEGKSYELIKKTSIQTALGPIMIVRFKKPEQIIVAGPSTNHDLAILLKAFPDEVEKLFIDGAFNRKTFTSINQVDALILSTGAVIGDDLNDVVHKTISATKLLACEVDESLDDGMITLLNEQETIGLKSKDYQAFSALLKHHDFTRIYIKGAVTNRYLEALLRLKKPLTLVIDDMTKLLIDDKILDYLNQSTIKLKVKKKKPLLFITMNPFKPFSKPLDKEAFKTALKSKIPYPIINVLEKEDVYD
jgi:hypothetical protein